MNDEACLTKVGTFDEQKSHKFFQKIGCFKKLVKSNLCVDYFIQIAISYFLRESLEKRICKQTVLYKKSELAIKRIHKNEYILQKCPVGDTT